MVRAHAPPPAREESGGGRGRPAPFFSICADGTLATHASLSPTKKTGATAAHIFGQGTTYTYDDIIFLPGFIGFGAHEVRGHV
jgi:hypothetical protein